MKLPFLQRWPVQIVRFRDRHFLTASMAAAALVSTADHQTRLSEQIALDHLLERLEKLRVFDTHKAVDLYRSFVQSMESDAEGGHHKIVSAVAAFRGKHDDAVLILYVAASIARANFDLPQAERDVLIELRDLLGLPKESFDRIWQATRSEVPVAQTPPGSVRSSAIG